MKGLQQIQAKVAKVPAANRSDGMEEFIPITDFVADRTEGASQAMRRLLEVEGVDLIIDEVAPVFVLRD